jgi:hypothetical protein
VRDTTVIIAIIAAIASVIAGIGGPVLAWRAARSGQKATRDIETRKIEQSQAESWRQDAVLLRAQMKEDREQAEAEIKRIEERLTAECDGKVGALNQRLDEMIRTAAMMEGRHRRELTAIEIRLEGTVAWIRAVVPIMREQGITFPAVPPGIIETDPGGMYAVRPRPTT